MNSSKTVIMIITIALIMLFVFPLQSMSTNDDLIQSPTRHKRWTFNTWRLHGRRQLPYVPSQFTNDVYSPKTSSSPSDSIHQYEFSNNEDGKARKIHERLLRLFQKLNRE